MVCRLLFIFVILGVVNGVWSQNACTGPAVLNAAACSGDGNSAEELALFRLVNEYRKSQSLPAVELSKPLSMVANRHLLDLDQNVRMFTHSWSDCPYDIKVEATWPCTLEAPKRLKSGYDGQGFETLYRTTTGKAEPSLAIEAWKKSRLHNSIILNLDIFSAHPWNGVGVAIDGQFACLWFGSSASGGSIRPKGALGLGVTYDQAVEGLTKTFEIAEKDTTVDQSRWSGRSADKAMTIELAGARSDINNASLSVAVKLIGGKAPPAAMTAVSKLLCNIFPEWTDRDVWLTSSISEIAANPTTLKGKILRDIAVTIEGTGIGSFKLSIAPNSKPKYIQVN